MNKQFLFSLIIVADLLNACEGWKTAEIACDQDQSKTVCEDDILYACSDSGFLETRACKCADEHHCEGDDIEGDDKDINHNNMKDERETISEPKDCRYHADCDTEEGKGDGFCDSFIGYKCSTKCQSDDDCIESTASEYNFVCRSDGRCAPNKFISTWEVTEDMLNAAPHKGSAYIILDLSNSAANIDKNKNCNFTINWGDGTEEHIKDCAGKHFNVTPDNNIDTLGLLVHEYLKADKYEVIITGTLDRFSLYSDGIKFKDLENSSELINIFNLSTTEETSKNFYKKHAKLLEIITFGPVAPGVRAFKRQNKFKISEIDIPNFPQDSSLAYAFYLSGFNEDGSYIAKWDTSNVTNMHSMFNGASAFNQDISKWDTTNVISMQHMFAGAKSFNEDISKWDTSNVVNMGYMFYNAQSFDKNIGNWNTSNVTDMMWMFKNDGKNGEVNQFHQDISNWEVRKACSNLSSALERTALSKDKDMRNKVYDAWHATCKNLTETILF